MARRSLTGLALALLIATPALTAVVFTPAPARADADPASDVLLGESVFYPYQPPVSQALQKQLGAETAAAARAHFPVKVAIIASPIDLGAIPALFGQPQRYAEFLDQEISFAGPVPVLVVMAAGYGVAGMPAGAVTAAGSLSKPAGKSSDALAQAAIVAVGKLASALGHPIAHAAPGSAAVTAGASGPSPALILAVVAVVAVLTAGAVIVVRRRAATR